MTLWILLSNYQHMVHWLYIEVAAQGASFCRQLVDAEEDSYDAAFNKSSCRQCQKLSEKIAQKMLLLEWKC